MKRAFLVLSLLALLGTGNITTGGGSPFFAENAYNTCADIGGGLCVNLDGGIQIANPVQVTGGLTFGSNGLGFNAGGTGCNGSVLCVSTLTYSNTGQVTWEIHAPTASGGLIIDRANSGADLCTTGTTGKILQVQKNHQDNFNVDCGGDITAFGNITANSVANASGEFMSGNATNVAGAAGVGDMVIGGANTTNNTSGTQVGDCSGGKNCGGHLHQGTYFEDVGQNAAAQTCTGPFMCEYVSVTTAPTSYQLTFQQSYTHKPFCQFVDYTHPGDVPTAWAFTGSSPFTAVTATVTTSAGDDVILSCTVGNGP